MNSTPILWTLPGRLVTEFLRKAGVKAVWVVASLIAMTLIAMVHYQMGREISFSLFYLAPVVFVAWHVGLRASVMVSAIAVGLWWITEQSDGPYHPDGWIPYWNGIVRFGIFMTSAYLTWRLHVLTVNLDATVEKRTADLEKETARRRRAEQEVAEASRKEQEHLACELHDQLGGYLAGLAFQAKAVEERISQCHPDISAELKPLVEGINEVNRQIRDYSHLFALFGNGEGDLAADLRRLAMHLARVYEVSCRLDIDDPLPYLTAFSSHQLQRIAQEAARNAIRHNGSHWITLRVCLDGTDLMMTITGDATAHPAPVTCPAGIGMHIMHYRAKELHGTLEYQPPSAGQVTSSVICRVPLNALGNHASSLVIPPIPSWNQSES